MAAASTKRGYKRTLSQVMASSSPLNTVYTTVDLPQELLPQKRRFAPKTSRMQVHTPEELRAIKVKRKVKAVKARIIARAEKEINSTKKEILRRADLVCDELDRLITPDTLPSEVDALAIEGAEIVRERISGDALDYQYLSDQDFDARLEEIELFDLCSCSDSEDR